MPSFSSGSRLLQLARTENRNLNLGNFDNLIVDYQELSVESEKSQFLKFLLKNLAGSLFAIHIVCYSTIHFKANI